MGANVTSRSRTGTFLTGLLSAEYTVPIAVGACTEGKPLIRKNYATPRNQHLLGYVK